MQEIIKDIEQTVESIKSLLEKRYSLVIMFSGGKDSSAVLGVFINAAHEIIQAGGSIEPQYLITSDTCIENPEVDGLKKANLSKLKAFCDKANIPLIIHETRPNLSQSWQYKVIGSRVLPTTVNSTYRQCSVDLKISSNSKKVKEIRNSMPRSFRYSLVTVLGSRDDESIIRANNIKRFGGSGSKVTQNENGESFYYPIKQWTLDHVWYFLTKSGQSPDAKWISYLKNHDDIFNLYKDSAGECVLLQPDTQEDNVTEANQSSCGARHGCSFCLASGDSGDKSMESLLEDERYQYMKPLNQIRNYLAEQVKDYSARRATGRTLKNGYLAIAPDCLGPKTCRNLLKACMSADCKEKERALKEGCSPKFQIITLEYLFGIEWSWQMLGLFKHPFEALMVYKEVYIDGDYIELPDIKVSKQSIPKKRYLKVADDWFLGDFENRGLSHPLMDMVEETCSGITSQNIEVDGQNKSIHLDQYEGNISVNEEGASLFLEFELDGVLSERKNLKNSQGIRKLLMYGFINTPTSMAKKLDEMVARLQVYEELELCELCWSDAKSLGESTCPDFTREHVPVQMVDSSRQQKRNQMTLF